MKLGFVFPGQGAQSCGMGKDLYDSYESVRKIYDRASKVLGFDVAELTFNSSEEELVKTSNAQITILVMSLGILEILKEHNIQAEYSCGLSLGEYTALIYSNALGIENGISLVKKRGEIMQANIPEGNWVMAGSLALADEKVEEACSKIQKGFAMPANYNCPGQVVISCDEEGFNEVEPILKEFGARKVSKLKASGPFHTEKMKEASEKFKYELKNVKFEKMDKFVFKNIDAKLYNSNDDMIDILSKHITNPVRFTSCIQEMVNQGVDTIIEIGPGKVLTSIIKRIDKNLELININNVESLENVLNRFSE